jgi:hypothetical protein
MDMVEEFVPEDVDCGLSSASSSLEENTSLRRGVRLQIKTIGFSFSINSSPISFYAFLTLT